MVEVQRKQRTDEKLYGRGLYEIIKICEKFDEAIGRIRVD